MATTVSLINMKGGVGKTTLAFNLAWYCAWQANMKVLAVDLDPQSNLSQYLMGAKDYLTYMDAQRPTIVEVFEQFSPEIEPIALDEARRAGRIKPGDLTLLVAFGAGLTYASALIRW